ncbi:E3 binding domain-containing protein [Lichenicoccus sp.]|uniref:E3 binding domain-containing protein n=1 Tax=Lichenicoccus sp. TaxID=2781899 RepID=UPI003D0DDDA2
MALEATMPALSPAMVPATTKVSPLARRIAGAKGIELGQIRGSGRDGKILKIDLGLPDQGAGDRAGADA